MKKELKSLTLDDLFSTQADPSTGLPKPRAPSREEREAMIAAAAEAARAKLRESPWRSTRVVLWMNQITCNHCGATHFAPAANGLTVEFTHKHQPASKQYISTHPAQANPNLERATEYRLGTVACCHECWPEEFSPATLGYGPAEEPTE